MLTATLENKPVDNAAILNLAAQMVMHSSGREAMETAGEDVKRFATLEDTNESGDMDSYYPEWTLKRAGKYKIKSWKQFMQHTVKHYKDVDEATPASAFGQLFRAEVQVKANTWYQRKKKEWTNYVDEVSSSKRQEFYAPLQGSGLPALTGQGEGYSETKIVGLDIELVNQKYMGGESFPSELFLFDQTGQINQRIQMLGESPAVWEEMYVAARIGGAARTFAGRTVPASNYTWTNKDGGTGTTPFSTTRYSNTAGDGNRPTTFGQLSIPAIKTAIEVLVQAKDLQGIPLGVDANSLLVSAFDTVNVDQFIHSTYYPAVQGQAGLTSATAVSGLSGTIGSDNSQWIRRITPYVNIFLQRGEWYAFQKGKGPIFQRFMPWEVLQEAPNAGQSFDRDLRRLRTRGFWAMDWVDSSFWYQGNDGTALVSQ